MNSSSQFASGLPTKSSYSKPNDNCVELTLNTTTGEVSMENTSDRSQGRITCSSASYARFLSNVRRHMTT